MNPYFAGGFLLTMMSFWIGLIWYGNRAGRNSASVDTSQRDTANANAATQATQAMLNARTNGIRTDTQLDDTLDKGNF